MKSLLFASLTYFIRVGEKIAVWPRKLSSNGGLPGSDLNEKPVVRFAHLRSLFFLILLKASFQRNGKTKPGNFVPGFSFVGVRRR
jgi:hypothetical protein